MASAASVVGDGGTTGGRSAVRLPRRNPADLLPGPAGTRPVPRARGCARRRTSREALGTCSCSASSAIIWRRFFATSARVAQRCRASASASCASS